MKTHRCGRCGTRYEHAAFVALALVERLEGSAITEHVVQWPDGTTIAVANKLGRIVWAVWTKDVPDAVAAAA